jgi:hypothetical protein
LPTFGLVIVNVAEPLPSNGSVVVGPLSTLKATLPVGVAAELTVTVTRAFALYVTVGALITSDGAALLTVKVALGPAAGTRLPARSLAVPAAMLIPIVPSPDKPDIVTVLVRLSVPLIVTEEVLAVLVLFKDTLPVARVMTSAPV